MLQIVFFVISILSLVRKQVATSYVSRRRANKRFAVVVDFLSDVDIECASFGSAISEDRYLGVDLQELKKECNIVYFNEHERTGC